MEAPPDVPADIPVPLDPAAMDVLRLAAHLGAEINDDVFVSYTTLLLGLLFAHVAPPPETLRSGVDVTLAPAWQTEANRALRVDAILREKNAGKPDNVMQKIVDNGLKSYFKENTLLEQGFVYEPSKSIRQVLKEAEAKAGAPITVPFFVRYALGD